MMLIHALAAFLLLAFAMLALPTAPAVFNVLLVLLALGFALVGSTTASQPPERPSLRRGLYATLGLLTGVELIYQLGYLGGHALAELCPLPALAQWLRDRDRATFLPGPSPRPWPSVAATLGLGVLAASYAWRAMPWPRLRWNLALGHCLFLGGWLIGHTTGLSIDVYTLQQEAGARLVEGQNPYASLYTNPYGDARFHGDEVITDGKINSFPYPPGSLLLVLPGYCVLGDVRWCLLAAAVAALGLLIAAGRRMGLPPGHPAELAGLAFFCHPQSWVLLELAWTEPLLLLAISVSIYALAESRKWLQVSALAVILIVKQYGVLWAILLGWSRRREWRSLAIAVGIATFVLLPFLVWDPSAAWRGMVRFHLVSPFRADCVSVPALVAVLTGYQLSPLWGFGMALAAILVMGYSPKPLAQLVLGGAAAYLAFIAFNKAAHMNYYWLVQGLLAGAVILSAAEEAKPNALS